MTKPMTDMRAFAKLMQLFCDTEWGITLLRAQGEELAADELSAANKVLRQAIDRLMVRGR